MLYRKIFVTGIATLLAGSAQGALAQSTGTISMTDAIAVAINSNPDVAQAQYNKEAIEFERKRAQGLYLPRLDFEASAGVRRLENPTRKSLHIGDEALYPSSVELTGEWIAVDFGRRRGELLRQAARVDGASLRVVERSEFIGLQVARQYLDVLLQQRVVGASQDDVAFHRNLVGDLATGVKQGSISIADQQQGEERLQAALVRQTEAEQALIEAQIKLRTLSGLDVSQVAMPAALDAGMPASESEAIGLARANNPRVKEAMADVDAAHSLADSTKGEMYPRIGLGVAGRYGTDIDGFQGETKDVQARVFLRYNVFNGGITKANYQEMVRRESEARYRLYDVARSAEEDVRLAWSTLNTQTRIVRDLNTQSRVSDDLLVSYRSQFNVGRRSLLDVLDAQNSRYNVQVRLEVARFSQVFAQYQTLAATNRFLTTLGISPAAGAGANDRGAHNYGPPKPAELEYRTLPGK